MQVQVFFLQDDMIAHYFSISSGYCGALGEWYAFWMRRMKYHNRDDPDTVYHELVVERREMVSIPCSRCPHLASIAAINDRLAPDHILLGQRLKSDLKWIAELSSMSWTCR
jgi:hypothetical protein